MFDVQSMYSVGRGGVLHSSNVLHSAVGLQRTRQLVHKCVTKTPLLVVEPYLASGKACGGLGNVKGVPRTEGTATLQAVDRL